jgi:hypothetical protein
VGGVWLGRWGDFRGGGAEVGARRR